MMIRFSVVEFSEKDQKYSRQRWKCLLSALIAVFCHRDAEGPEQGFAARPWSWAQGDVVVPWWRSFPES